MSLPGRPFREGGAVVRFDGAGLKRYRRPGIHSQHPAVVPLLTLQQASEAVTMQEHYCIVMEEGLDLWPLVEELTLLLEELERIERLAAEGERNDGADSYQD